MSSPRNYTIIRTGKSQEECQAVMDYPYTYIDDEYQEHYSLDEIRRPILVEAEGVQADAGDFPKNIQEHFWVRVGENDGDSWLSVGLLTNGNYFFYEGGCDYTGFDCSGGMSLWVSKSWENIVDHAFTEEVYELYTQQKVNYLICAHCDDEAATMPNDWNDDGDLCPDCYWDLDSAKKRERRADPEWRYDRSFSAAKVLLGKSDEEAHQLATISVQKI
jgi:hypothetical protein